jgi:hypothetical protein
VAPCFGVTHKARFCIAVRTFPHATDEDPFWPKFDINWSGPDRLNNIMLFWVFAFPALSRLAGCHPDLTTTQTSRLVTQHCL